MPGQRFEGNPVDEGTTEGLLKLPCIVQKNPHHFEKYVTKAQNRKICKIKVERVLEIYR